MTILILSETGDEHAEHMHQQLTHRGIDTVCVDGSDFPSDISMEFDPNNGAGAIHTAAGKRIAFEDISSIYWRNYFGVGTPRLPDEEQSYIAENDSRSLFESFLCHVPARWVNSWAAIQMHQTKPYQLAKIAQMGVTIPKTIISNTPAAVRAFAASTPKMIFKPVQGGAHTQRLAASDLTDERLQSLKLAPVTLQEEIEGTNIRAFVAGNTVLACDIPTSEVDFRDDLNATMTPHDLSPQMQQTCRDIARSLGLLWTGIDFRLSKDGRYFFLEANPSPMFIGFEELSGLPLTQTLIDLLTQPQA